jgi:23S rRNA pseudouridine1911/1915/1917 synthase
MSTETLFVSSEMVSLRLDRLLSEKFPHYSRTYFQSLIEQGFVLVNGLPMKKKDQPKLGDEIEICFQLTPEISLKPENIPLDILYEDDHIIAVNKPAGMVVHPAPGHSTATFVHALLYHCKQLPHSDTLRPGIVHRLDKETSGVLIAAKTVTAHQKLVEMFCQRGLEKIYFAICVGSPGDKEIVAPIKRHPTRRQQMSIDPAGKPAISRCRTLESHGPLSLVEILLVTGRTHQIRVHLQHEKTPVLGDRVYGLTAWNQKFKTSRQLLHAYQLKCFHPITGASLRLLAPLPPEFKKFTFTEILDK